jgi:hypothetical protein
MRTFIQQMINIVPAGTTVTAISNIEQSGILREVIIDEGEFTPIPGNRYLLRIRDLVILDITSPGYPTPAPGGYVNCNFVINNLKIIVRELDNINFVCTSVSAAARVKSLTMVIDYE